MTKLNYSAGIQTRKKILSSAKKLFYVNGFKKTSLQQIAKDAGIRQSLLYYYFESKDTLATEIFLELNVTHDRMILDEIKRRKLIISKTVERSLYVASYFRLCLLNQNLAAFIAEVNEIDLQYNDAFTQSAYKAIIDDNPSSLDETTFEFIVIQNLGINTLLFRLFTTNILKATIDEIIRFKVIQLLKSLSIRKERINILLEEIFNLEKDIQFNLIDYFEVKLRE